MNFCLGGIRSNSGFSFRIFSIILFLGFRYTGQSIRKYGEVMIAINQLNQTNLEHFKKLNFKVFFNHGEVGKIHNVVKWNPFGAFQKAKFSKKNSTWREKNMVSILEFIAPCECKKDILNGYPSMNHETLIHPFHVFHLTLLTYPR